MRRTIVAILGVAVVLAALGLAPRKGSLHATSGTSTITRNFRGSVSELIIAPDTQDVQVLHSPHYASQDTFAVRAGDVMNWEGLDIYGFTILRPSATAVDAYWK